MIIIPKRSLYLKVNKHYEQKMFRSLFHDLTTIPVEVQQLGELYIHSYCFGSMFHAGKFCSVAVLAVLWWERDLQNRHRRQMHWKHYRNYRRNGHR